MNEVWVPTKWIESRPPHKIRFEMDFKWESVNQKVDEKLFTIKGLGLEVGTLIVNARQGDPVIESKIGGQY